MIHTFVGVYIKYHEKEEFGDRLLADYDQFEPVVQREQLLELVRKAVGPGANDDDWRVLFQHGMCIMCFCYGIDQITSNI